MNSASRLVLALALVASACAASRSATPASPVAAASPALRALKTDLDAILNDPALAHGTWGVEVRSLKSSDTLYASNERKLLMPASNMKIVTLAAAAEKLGWDYTFLTTLWIAGTIENGVLNGDLVAQGLGDPSLMANGQPADVFGRWADRLKQLGVRAVTGRIVGDDNAFEDQALGFGWSWDDLPDDYAAGVGALQYNENAVRVTVTAGPKPGDLAAVSADPPGSGVEIVSSAVTGAAGSARSLVTRRLPGNQRLQISGSIAADASPAALVVAVDNPTLFFVEMLRSALILRGIDVRGPAVDIDDLARPPDVSNRTPLAHRSEPLSTLAVRLMKDSQNQYAETFMKALTLGAAPAANAFDARAVYQEVFDRWGVHAGGLIVRDGSGLSRYDYVTADAIATILSHVYRDAKLRGPFEASLPVAGRDGTLANRMKGTPAEGNARAKTGSMSNVRAISGYVTAADGEPLVFAIIANNFETPAAVVNSAADAIIVRLANHKR